MQYRVRRPELPLAPKAPLPEVLALRELPLALRARPLELLLALPEPPREPLPEVLLALPEVLLALPEVLLALPEAPPEPLPEAPPEPLRPPKARRSAQSVVGRPKSLTLLPQARPA